MLQKAAKLKTKFSVVTVQAQHLISQIESGLQAWTDFNNSENVGKLKTSLDELNGSMTEFDQKIMINDCKTLKQDYGAEHLVVKLNDFLAKQQQINVVEHQRLRIVKRQRIK